MSRFGVMKLHFLNPVPIRLVHDRWVSKYSEPWVAGLSDLENRLEAEGRTMEKVYEIYIRATPERLWQAITSPKAPDVLLGEGENLVVDPPHKLVQTMRALWNDDVEQEGFSRITWEINQVGDSCCLVVTHDQLRPDANNQLYGGWPMILSGLRTWLETGEVLTTSGSLMFA